MDMPYLPLCIFTRKWGSVIYSQITACRATCSKFHKINLNIALRRFKLKLTFLSLENHIQSMPKCVGNHTEMRQIYFRIFLSSKYYTYHFMAVTVAVCLKQSQTKQNSQQLNIKPLRASIKVLE